MEIIVETCCCIDVHQKTFGTRTHELRQAFEWLTDHQVSDVFMESSGQYWVPIFNIFSDGPFHITLANPQHIKNLPGRKTDVKDAEWIAQLGRCGLIQASYIPD